MILHVDMDAFLPPQNKWETVDHALDAISGKYGKKTALRASCKDSRKKRRQKTTPETEKGI